MGAVTPEQMEVVMRSVFSWCEVADLEGGAVLTSGNHAIWQILGFQDPI